MSKKLIAGLIVLAGVIMLAGGGLVLAYGMTRLSRSDCTKYEQYDSLRGECYFECDSDEQCEEIAKKVEAELDAFFKDSQSKISTTKPAPQKSETTTATATQQQEESKSTQSMESTSSLKAYTLEDTGSDTGGSVYTVTGSQTLSPTPSSEDQKLWDLFLKVASKQIVAERLETFEVFNDENNDSAASVWESSTPGKWHMNVNAAFASDRKDMIHTMVHEYGHILTLNSSQVEKTEGACPSIVVPEGCVKSGTILDVFYEKFWQQYGSEAGGRTDDPVAEYNEDEFVTEYASTNMIEDLAESFAFFVLRPAPNGSTIKDQKIQLLYNNSEMVATRNRIRASLSTEL